MNLSKCQTSKTVRYSGGRMHTIVSYIDKRGCHRFRHYRWGSGWARNRYSGRPPWWAVNAYVRLLQDRNNKKLGST